MWLIKSFSVNKINKYKSVKVKWTFWTTIRSGELKKAGEIEQDAGEIEQRESAS